ncbi:MAG: pilus assembly protein N-terminal domain-containing protein [Bryobacteraceae bacterium]|nr:pilus assembly protein N-terminal domain-containing protein [Bryobacteraceae bacterium]MDW8379487.1 pilus assembly protein N-terminal domain-containing protein [Bryobacterales bacterium]
MDRRNVLLEFFIAFGAVSLYAQTAPVREIELLVGRGELLQFERDLNKVVVSEPKIADAVVVSPREVMVNGKGVGKATLIVWETGSSPSRYDITVKEDTARHESVVKEIQAKLPGVTVTGTPQKLVLTGEVKDPEDIKRAEAIAAAHASEVVNLLKLPPPADPRQILLQVKFASVDRAALTELGFNYFSRNDKMLGSVSTQQFQQPRFSQLQFQNQEFANATVNFADLLNIFIFRPDLNIGGTIRALQGRNLLQILAEPNLIAIEGKEASFLAGGEFPFPTLTATTTGGAVAPVITVQFKRFGIQLGFTPTLTSSGAIHLKVSPEVSSLDFSNAVTLQGFLIPAVATRRADTEVVLRDGETFAIAGLLDNRVVQVLSKLPFLGDVPIVGNLFRSRSTKKTQDELLVVITPRFVKPLPPGETAKLPTTIEDFLPSSAQERAAKQGKKRKEKTPAVVGPSGHQKP